MNSRSDPPVSGRTSVTLFCLHPNLIVSRDSLSSNTNSGAFMFVPRASLWDGDVEVAIRLQGKLANVDIKGRNANPVSLARLINLVMFFLCGAPSRAKHAGRHEGRRWICQKSPRSDRAAEGLGDPAPARRAPSCSANGCGSNLFHGAPRTSCPFQLLYV